jgi:uncharacterized membrane protein YfcA
MVGYYIMQILLYLVIGFVIGGISGTLGIGGGVLLVPILIWMFGFDQPRATGTTLAILVPPIGLLAAWKYYVQGLIDLEAAAWIACAFAIGAYGGASIVTYIPVSVLRLGFGLLLIYVGMRFILASSSEAASAALGLAAVGIAWLVYWGLRVLGLRHLPKPGLTQAIHRIHQSRGEIDYHI